MEITVGEPCATDAPAKHHQYDRHAPLGRAARGMARTKASDRQTLSFSLRKMGAVHDLRNLLQIVASALQLIDREADRGAVTNVHRLTQSALLSIDRAATLSRSILDNSSQGGVQPDPVDLTDTLAVMRDRISLTAGRSIAVGIRAEDGVRSVRCDRGQFEDALLNLVANARDAMPDGGRVTISLSQSVSEGSSRPRVVVRVTDTGQGMTDETRRQALVPFFTTKPKGKGTGLGLATVSDFATRAGGSVEIESVVGKGTSVILSLPVEDVDQQVAEEVW